MMLPLLLCKGPKACGILGASIFSFFLFWPLYTALSLKGFFGKDVKLMYFGSAMAALSTIWIYDLTVNVDRPDLYWIPASHLAFAGIMLLMGLKNRSTEDAVIYDD